MKKIMDRVSMVLLAVSISLFGLSGISLLGAILFYFRDTHAVPPEFTLLEIGVTIGLLAMVTLPFYIITALIATRHGRTDHKNDDHPERGAAGRS